MGQRNDLLRPKIQFVDRSMREQSMRKKHDLKLQAKCLANEII